MNQGQVKHIISIQTKKSEKRIFLKNNTHYWVFSECLDFGWILYFTLIKNYQRFQTVEIRVFSPFFICRNPYPIKT